MAKKDEMDAVVAELRRSCETICGLVDRLQEMALNGAGENAKPLTLVDVRTALMPIARSGKSDEIRALLQKHGAESLTALNPAEYAALLKEAEVL
jgi:hypothetical protein